MPTVAIAFRENTKPFDESDSVFNKDTFLRNLAIIFVFLFGQRRVLGTLFWQKRIGTLASSVDIAFRYSIAGRYMGIGTVFPQIFQGGQQQILYAQLWRSPTTPGLFRISFSQNFYPLVKCCTLYPGNPPKSCV